MFQSTTDHHQGVISYTYYTSPFYNPLMMVCGRLKYM
jgi:hypothetical protein